MFPLFCWLAISLLVQRSRRAFVSAVFLVLCGYAIYLSRIRVAVVLAVVAVLFLAMFVRKTGLSVSRLAMRLIISGFALSLLVMLLVALIPSQKLSLKGEHEKTFFAVVLDPAESIDRINLWEREIADLPNHSMWWGYGAGTGGSMRPVIADQRLLLVPVVNDTGMALLYHELGLFGYLTFAICYVGIPLGLICAWYGVAPFRRRRSRQWLSTFRLCSGFW